MGNNCGALRGAPAEGGASETLCSPALRDEGDYREKMFKLLKYKPSAYSVSPHQVRGRLSVVSLLGAVLNRNQLIIMPFLS